MLAITTAAILLGVDGSPVTIEVHTTTGLPTFTVVGQPDGVCREARDRVRSAIQSAGCAFPMQRITVNLAPSAERKHGAGLDLGIAIALLAASDQLPEGSIDNASFLGELGLDGTLRPVQGMVPLAEACSGRRLVVPLCQVGEASLVGAHEVRGGATLLQVVEALRGDAPWPTPVDVGRIRARSVPAGDMADVRGQLLARLAIEVAAAGAHHVLLTGPPGAGKTMLAERLPGLLPDLAHAEALEATRVHSAAGSLDAHEGLLVRPPYIAPHHTTSAVALIGGGTASLRPGAVSAAHRGVLFLDELAEFPPLVLDTLRQPMEEGVVRVHRAVGAATFPARFLLVAAMNPCPCGDGLTPGRCRCTPTQRLRGIRRVSVPLLDRFDLRILVERPGAAEVLGGPAGESTVDVAARVACARSLAVERGVTSNSMLRGAALTRHASLSAPASALLDRRLRSGALSARGLDRVRRVARTLADLRGEAGPISIEHLHLALGLRHEVVPEAIAG